MKYKTQDTETQKDNSLLELVQAKYHILSVLTSGRLFCYANGYKDAENFLTTVYEKSVKSLFEILQYLYVKLVPFSDNVFSEIQYYDSINEVFETLSELEDQFYDKVSSIVLEAQENKDAELLTFLLPKAQNEHLMCRAYEAIKNGQDPSRLCNANYCPW